MMSKESGSPFSDAELNSLYLDAQNYSNPQENEAQEIQLENDEDRYQVIRLLGQGAQKKVFLAKDSFLDRNVAYAIPKQTLSKEETQQFLKEARISSLLEHPNILPVYDVGLNQDDEPFFVLRLYDGENLQTIIDREFLEGEPTFSLSEKLNLYLKICDAVIYAHERGLLHLDIKPSNIQVNDHGETFLCDWGIAKPHFTDKASREKIFVEIESNWIESGQDTLNGIVKGTPGYMAPEQKNPNLERNEQCDVYSLGCLLRAVLTGHPSKNQPQKDIPRSLLAITNRAADEDFEKRYLDVSELKQDIIAFESGCITIAEEASPYQALKRWMTRHKQASTVAIICLIVMALISATYLNNLHQQKELIKTYQKELETGEKLLENFKAIQEAKKRQP